MLAPTLIVGLGGTGSRIVANVQKKATEIQRKNIGFVVLDTDANELRVLQEKGFTGTFIQTSSKLTVGEYLNIDRDARDNWFPVNEILNRKTVSEGAGQIRAISRLAMNTTIRSGALDGLHKAIDNLYRLTGDDMKQALRVIIVSSWRVYRLRYPSAFGDVYPKLFSLQISAKCLKNKGNLSAA